MNVQRTALALFLIAGSSAAVAHPGHSDGFLAAVAHPWLGWDHLLAMVLVGILAAGYGGLRGLALPVAFVASLMVAAAWAAMGAGAAFVPYVESAILASLLVLGALVAVQRQFSLPLLAALVAVLGFSHGFAHGLELSAGQGLALAGMALSTAVLHGAGFALSRGLGPRFAWTLRALGLMIGFAGAAALLLRA
jgi:urease accessory protein